MRKGFTLIELVVVIAVIAILSAVAVVSYVTITNRAKQSNDQQKVNQVNLSLSAAEISRKPKTMHDALLGVKEDGFLPENFKAEAKDYTFAYKMSENRFVILQKGKVVYPANITTPDSVDLWLFSDTGENLTGGYSYYLRGESLDKAITVTSGGLDVGANTAIPSVTYQSDSDKEVLIRTNGGSLNVDAAQGTINHYNYAEMVNIIKVAPHSYHENGTVPFLKIKEGHAEIEKDGWINAVHVLKSSDTGFNNVEVTVKSNDVPKFSRDKVTLSGSEVKVCTVTVENETNAIYLTQDGIYEQIMYAPVVNGTESSTKSYVTGDADASKMNTIADQVSNNIGGEEGVDYTINPETKAIDVINPDVAVVTEGGVDDWQAQAASAFEGTGTQRDPFLIYDKATFQLVSTLYEEGYNYFKVKDGVTAIDCSAWTPVYLNGSFDGNGVILRNVSSVLFQNVGKRFGEGANTQDIVVKDITAEMNIAPDPANPYSTGAMIKNIANTGKTRLENITIHGSIEGYYNLGSFFNYGPTNIDNPSGQTVYAPFTMELINCKSDATLICATDNSVGGLFGHPYTNASNKVTLTIRDTEYTGHAYLSGSAKLYALGGYGGDSATFYNIVESINGQAPTNQNAALSGQYSHITKVNPTKESAGFYVAKQSETKKIIVSICTQFTSYDEGGNKIVASSGITTVKRIAELTDLSGSDVKVFDLFTSVSVLNQDGVSRVENGVLMIYNGAGYSSIDGTIRLQVNQYKANGEYVAAGSFQLAAKSGPTGSWTIN